MAVFGSGELTVDQDASGSVLRYHLVSRALLFCFLAPLLFLAIAQLTVFLVDLSKAPAAPAKTANAAGKTAAPKAADPKKADAKKADAKKAEIPMNPIDKFLGAPEPKKPDKKKADDGEDKDKKPKPTAAYVFAGIFAALYVIGRILEDWLIKSLFRKRLHGA
jgi:hypothetical protein